ncbi:MAG: hypothetical protein K0R76_1341 [Alphaproteobacteria bacterium]|jgi:hypothetical protein|nr:hypothetical protein [Alphaproteobacteria bacterium]
MMQKKITQAALAIGLGMGVAIAAVMDPNTRMEKVKDLFTQYGDDTFKVLNGQGIGGVGSTADGKGQQAGGYADIAMVVNSTDDNAFVFCVVDSKWAVYPPEPQKIGTNAMTATDSHGTPFVATLIDALKKSITGKAHAIRYFVNTPGGVEERLATVWSSKNLLTRKNTGKKFFCGTSVKASS